MDLLKIALKLKAFLDSDLLGDILEIALEAWKLDVEASRYEVSGCGGGSCWWRQEWREGFIEGEAKGAGG